MYPFGCFSSCRCLRSQRLFVLVVMWVLFVTGCFQPRDLTQRLQHLTVENLHRELGFISVRIESCDGTTKLGEQVIERRVDLPFGGEIFYLPASISGPVVLKIAGYQSEQKKVWLQHAHVLFTIEKGQRYLPTTRLVEGKPTAAFASECLPPTEEPPPTTPPASFNPDSVKVDQGALSGLPGLFTGTSLAPKTPAPSTPSVGQDRLQKRTPLSWGSSINAIRATGNRLIILNGASSTRAAHIKIIDVVYGKSDVSVPLEIDLKPGCSPFGLDVQGEIIAVTCRDLGRLFFFDMNGFNAETRANTIDPYGPLDGVPVNQSPTAVRMSGPVAVVTNYEDQHVTLVRIDKWEIPPVTYNQGIGERPAAVTAVGDRFFIANVGSSNITSFKVDPDLKTTGNHTTYLAGSSPVALDASGDYLISANIGSKSVHIDNLRTGRNRVLYFDLAPHDVKLIGHTALVATPGTDQDSGQLHVIDLQLGKRVQVIDMGAAVNRIAVTGEWVAMTTKTGEVIARASFSNIGRNNLHLLRVGASPSAVHIADSNAYLHDPLTQYLSIVDVYSQRFLRKVPEVPMGHWMSGDQDFLFHTGPNNKTLVIRRLYETIGKAYGTLHFDEAILGGRVVPSKEGTSGSSIYLRLCEWENQNGRIGCKASSISRLRIDAAGAPETWEKETGKLNFDTGAFHLVDVLPWDETRLVVADSRIPALFMLDAQRFFHNSGNVVQRRYDELQSQPQQLVRIGETLALSQDNGTILFFKMPGLSEPVPLVITSERGQLGQMTVYKDRFLAVADKSTGQVVFIEPASRKIIARVQVGCGPSGIGFWSNSADPIWPNWMIVSNQCSDTLALVPLTFTQ